MEKLILEQISGINDKLNAIARDLGENTAQHNAIGQRLDQIHEQTVKTNGRVTILEGFRVKIIAYATAVSVIFGAMFKLFR